MIKLNLPDYKFTIRDNNGRKEIFDSGRKKYVALSPEEWVRQNFIKYLVNEKKFPESLIVIESQLFYNKQKKRSDILAYNVNREPLLLVECKAPSVKIDDKVFNQVAMYNMSLKVKYLIVTNGLQHYCCYIDHEKSSYKFLKEVPVFETINEID